MKDIYVVVAEDGEYSDYSMQVLCWFETEAEADAETDRLKAAQRAHNEERGWWEYDNVRYTSIALPHGTTLAGKKLI